MRTTIYGAYLPIPTGHRNEQYDVYQKFFESELDCARECVNNGWKYKAITVEPDSEKVRREHYNIPWGENVR